MKITEADFIEFELGGKTYWKIDCTNEKAKQILDNEEKLEQINELVKELKNDYEESAFMKFTIKLKKILEENT